MRPELAEAAKSFRLATGPARWRGRSGNRRGLGVGSSQEFLDFRDYSPGDDLRHLDWRGYARTDQLKIRLFQEEVAPHVDVIVDASASMASTSGKERATRDLVQLFAAWAAREGSRARCLRAGGGDLGDAERRVFAGGAPFAAPGLALRQRGLRVVVSDFLQPDDPAPALRKIAAGAAALVVVQLLDPWERQPQELGATTLRDCESDAQLEVQLDARTLTAYQGRLQRLCEGVQHAVMALGGVFVGASAASPGELCRRHLLPAGVVEPAA